MDHDLDQLVRPDEGLISGEIFHSQEIYERELEHVFARCWLFLAHDSQIPKPGDFFATYMGEDPILVVRQRDGSVKAFLNACRHRGMRVCRADAGNVKAFMCSYHGWTFGASGELVSVPYPDTGYDALDRSQWGLVEVARLESYKGLWFGSWDESIASLEDYLGPDMRWYLDTYFDRREGGSELIGGVNKWVVKANWKLGAEQFASDMFHVNASHISALAGMAGPDAGPPPLPEYPPGRQFSSRNGHGAGFFVDIGPMAALGDDILMAYYGDIYAEVADRLGEVAARGPIGSGHHTVFPNFSYLPGTGVARVWHPKGPDAMEVWSWIVVDAAAPDEVKEAQRLNTTRTFNPSGIFEQDDSENWGEVQRNMRSLRLRRTPLNYQMGLGQENQDYGVDVGGLPGPTSYLMGEQAARGFYRRWLEVMGTPPDERIKTYIETAFRGADDLQEV